MADADDAADALGAFVRQLRADLRWDPATDATAAAKRAFVDALTEVAALPLDSMSMEVRRLLVTSDPSDSEDVEGVEGVEGLDDPEQSADAAPAHLLRVVAALASRDVLLKCKAASAVGSLCVSRVAGQRLLDVVGAEVLARLRAMALSRNQWAQADALSVLGWVVVIADARALAAVAALVPPVLEALRRHLALLLATAALLSSEQAANFRVYALVLLLNLCQRDVAVFVSQARVLADVLSDALLAVLVCRPEQRQATALDASEAAELLRLAVATLALALPAVDGVRERMLERKAVPVLLKLKKLLDGGGDGPGGPSEDDADAVAARLMALATALLATS